MPVVNAIIISSDSSSALSMINAARTKWGLGTVSKTFTGTIQSADIQYLKDRVSEANTQAGAGQNMETVTGFDVGQPIRASIIELLKALATAITNHCACNARCSCDCNYSCTCNCNYACTCNGRCSCDCNYACTCNCNYSCTCNGRCACNSRCYCDCHNNDGNVGCGGFADEW